MENREVRNIKTMRIKNLDKFIEKNKLEEILPNNFCCVFENLGKVLDIDTVAIIDRIYFSRKEYEEKKNAICNNRYLEILEASDNYIINTVMLSGIHLLLYIYDYQTMSSTVPPLQKLQQLL